MEGQVFSPRQGELDPRTPGTCPLFQTTGTVETLYTLTIRVRYRAPYTVHRPSLYRAPCTVHRSFPNFTCEAVKANTRDLQKALHFDVMSAIEYDNGVFWISWEICLHFFDVVYLNWNPKLFLYRYHLVPPRTTLYHPVPPRTTRVQLSRLQHLCCHGYNTTPPDTTSTLTGQQNRAPKRTTTIWNTTRSTSWRYSGLKNPAPCGSYSPGITVTTVVTCCCHSYNTCCCHSYNT